jgi:hypothetical protein
MPTFDSNFYCVLSSIEHSLQHALEKEAHIPLQSLMIFIQNSFGNAWDDKNHIPFESLVISLANLMQHVL